jgi:hypothetical protein
VRHRLHLGDRSAWSDRAARSLRQSADDARRRRERHEAAKAQTATLTRADNRDDGNGDDQGGNK